MTFRLAKTTQCLLACATLAFSSALFAAELIVMSSGGFYSAMQELAPLFEKTSGHHVILISGSSMGASPTAIPTRIQRGEAADLLMMAGSELDKLIEQGYAVAGSRVDLVHSKIGMVVRKSAAKPDIRTKEAFERTLLNAHSIAYSASASGVYLAKEVFPRIGAENHVNLLEKAKEVVKDRVASVVARGDVEIGFQQISELLPEPGTDFVGEIPAPYQKVTIFSAGLARDSKQRDAAHALIAFLTSPAAFPIIRAQGLEPAVLAK